MTAPDHSRSPESEPSLITLTGHFRRTSRAVEALEELKGVPMLIGTARTVQDATARLRLARDEFRRDAQKWDEL